MDNRAFPWYRAKCEPMCFTTLYSSTILFVQNPYLHRKVWKNKGFCAKPGAVMRYSFQSTPHFISRANSSSHGKPYGVLLLHFRPQSWRRPPHLPLCQAKAPQHRRQGALEDSAVMLSGHKGPPRSSPPPCALPCRSPRRMTTRAPGRTINHAAPRHL